MKKIIILSLALVLALAVVGVGYAGWFATLVVNGTVNTGSLEASIVEVIDGATDTEDEGKDYSSIECYVDQDGVLQVTVIGAYPSIWYTNEFLVYNIGTIPLHIYAVNVCNPDPDNYNIDVVIDGMDAGYVQLHPDGPPATGRVTVHLEQSAPELSQLSFSAAIECCNWNETP